MRLSGRRRFLISFGFAGCGFTHRARTTGMMPATLPVSLQLAKGRTPLRPRQPENENQAREGSIRTSGSSPPFPPSPQGKPGLVYWKSRDQLPQRACPGFSPEFHAPPDLISRETRVEKLKKRELWVLEVLVFACFSKNGCPRFALNAWCLIAAFVIKDKSCLCFAMEIQLK